MPILGTAGINSSAVASAVAAIDGVHDSVMEGLGTQDLDFTATTAGGDGAEENEGQPPTKKMYAITIASIQSCIHVHVYVHVMLNV